MPAAMTAQQLIDELRKLQPTTRVVVSGYEGGFDDPVLLMQRIDIDGGAEHYGAHGPIDPTMNVQNGTLCLVIARTL